MQAVAGVVKRQAITQDQVVDAVRAQEHLVSGDVADVANEGENLAVSHPRSHPSPFAYLERAAYPMGSDPRTIPP